MKIGRIGLVGRILGLVLGVLMAVMAVAQGPPKVRDESASEWQAAPSYISPASGGEIGRDGSPKLDAFVPELRMQATEPAPRIWSKDFFVDLFAHPVSVYEVIVGTIKVFEFDKVPPITLSGMAGLKGTQSGMAGLQLTMARDVGKDLSAYAGLGAWIEQNETTNAWSVYKWGLVFGLRF